MSATSRLRIVFFDDFVSFARKLQKNIFPLRENVLVFFFKKEEIYDEKEMKPTSGTVLHSFPRYNRDIN